ncbi:MAG: DnaA regulatory inactivator Hda [Pseudomonadota bacterium]|nr:DnaA regulatory inactivator Hda [Pseudomonadota bacterium]
MAEQLVLELAPAEPPSFANFLVGSNSEAVDTLRQLSEGTLCETGVAIWGANGAGKSHLLYATTEAAKVRSRSALLIAEPQRLGNFDSEEVARTEVVAIDNIDAADADTQARLFTLYNAVRAAGHHLLFASSVPPARLNARDDLRTRLGWGLVYEILPLDDDAKPAALTAYARQRGFSLSVDVVSYLLVHGRRDMTTLLATLAALDRHSLATQRPVTVPLLRTWLQRDHEGA